MAKYKSIYDKENDPTIEICLNCKNVSCNHGSCAKVRVTLKQEDKKNDR